MRTTWLHFRRLIDWRFLVMLIVLILVSTVCYSFLQRVQQADSLIDTAEHSVQQVRDLRKQLATQQQMLAEQQQAATERSRRARAERDRLQAQLALVLDYLRDQGIDVPKTLTTPPPNRASTPTTTRAPATRATTSRPPSTRPRAAAPSGQPSLLDDLLGLPDQLLNPAGKERGKSAQHRNPNAGKKGPKR